MSSDQKEMWNQKHAAGEHEVYGFDPRELVNIAEQYILPHSKILELGCGIGTDAAYFVSKGHTVTATDFSEVVIRQNQSRWKDSGVTFEALDVTKSFPFKTAEFDLVYASLSLHYFDEQTTHDVFNEIHRVLKPSGKLAFSCKSVKDPKYGEGQQIAPDVFERNGHVRHFFSAEYCHKLLDKLMKIRTLQEASREYIGDTSAFIYCVGEK